MTKLSSALPAGDRDGLAAIARELVERPQRQHVIVALVDCKSITTDTDLEVDVPTARIRAVEVLTEADAEQAQQLMRHTHERRTGKTALPLDLRTLSGLAGHTIDVDTGEIR